MLESCCCYCLITSTLWYKLSTRIFLIRKMLPFTEWGAFFILKYYIRPLACRHLHILCRLLHKPCSGHGHACYILLRRLRRALCTLSISAFRALNLLLVILQQFYKLLHNQYRSQCTAPSFAHCLP